jgi:hypothetical protein
MRRTTFEHHPCRSPGRVFVRLETGGRVTWSSVPDPGPHPDPKGWPIIRGRGCIWLATKMQNRCQTASHACRPSRGPKRSYLSFDDQATNLATSKADMDDSNFSFGRCGPISGLPFPGEPSQRVWLEHCWGVLRNPTKRITVRQFRDTLSSPDPR